VPALRKGYITKGSQNGVRQSGLTGFWTSSIVRYFKTTAFLKQDLFPSSGEGVGHTSSVRSIERAGPVITPRITLFN
jgi:hypothetical protein